MLKIILLVLGSVVLHILQITLVPRISIFGSKLDLPLALIVSVALFRGPLHGELVGFASGLFCDLFSGGPLGLQSFSKTVVGYCTGFVPGRLYSDNFITQSASGFVATLVGETITLTHLSLISAESQFSHVRFSGLILVAILNSMLVIGVFRILKKLIKSEAYRGRYQLKNVWHR